MLKQIKLNPTESEAIFHRLVDKYFCEQPKGGFLYELWCEPEVISYPKGWQWVEQFFQDNDYELIYFGNQPSDLSGMGIPPMFALGRGWRAWDLFIQTVGVPNEVFLTNPASEFLIGFSHEGGVYTCGAAMGWLKNAKNHLKLILGITDFDSVALDIQGLKIMGRWGNEIIVDGVIYGSEEGDQRKFNLKFTECVNIHLDPSKSQDDREDAGLNYGFYLNRTPRKFFAFSTDAFRLDFNYDETVVSLGEWDKKQQPCRNQ